MINDCVDSVIDALTDAHTAARCTSEKVIDY